MSAEQITRYTLLSGEVIEQPTYGSPKEDKTQIVALKVIAYLPNHIYAKKQETTFHISKEDAIKAGLITNPDNNPTIVPDAIETQLIEILTSLGVVFEQ